MKRQEAIAELELQLIGALKININPHLAEVFEVAIRSMEYLEAMKNHIIHRGWKLEDTDNAISLIFSREFIEQVIMEGESIEQREEA